MKRELNLAFKSRIKSKNFSFFGLLGQPGEKIMINYKTAEPKELEVKTTFADVTVGIEPKTMLELRFDLNGLRFKNPESDAIYLMDQGCLRLIPNPETYNNLFRNWEGIILNIDINIFPICVPITDGAILARPFNENPVYLIDNFMKRLITSPVAMDDYWFAWDRVYKVPPILLDFIPTGPNINPST